MDINDANSTEDTDMTEFEGEKVVTMMDVLQEQQEFEDDANAVLGASDDKDCTYAKGYIKRQAIYACLTCCADAKVDPSKRAGVCLACSLNCHESHELIELYTKRNFRCDCGNPKFNSHPCQFVSDKTDGNEENKYNQNFSGLYCTCHRPYPDPEANSDEDMIQCIICEDWLHASHLEATVPANEQYAEMICKGCMEVNDFIHDYCEYAVNFEGIDVDVTTVIDSANGCKGKLENGGTDAEHMNNIDNKTVDINSYEITNKTPETVLLNADKESDLDSQNVDKIGGNTEILKKSDSDIVNLPKEEQKDGNKQDQQENLISNTPDQDTESAEAKETNAKDVENPIKNEIEEQNQTCDKTPPETGESTMQEITEIESKDVSGEVLNSKDTADTTECNEPMQEDTPVANDQIIGSEETAAQLKDEMKDQTTIAENKVNENKMSDTKPALQAKENEVKEIESDSQTKDKQSVEDIESKKEPNEKPSDITTKIEMANDKETENTIGTTSENNALKASCDENIQEIQKTQLNKRKLSTELAIEITTKRTKRDSKSCIRPKAGKRRLSGATFWPADFRQKLCTCNECLSMYKDYSVLFLIDPEDTVTAYETLGKEKTNGAATQYEKGLEALSSLDRTQQINALTEYNKMRDKLINYLKSFKDRKEIVKEEDIKAFFEGMKLKREPDGVYFCR